MASLFKMTTSLLVVVSLIFALDTILVFGADPTPGPIAVCSGRVDNMTIDTTNATRFAACNKCVDGNTNTTTKAQGGVTCMFMEVKAPKDTLICGTPEQTGEATGKLCSNSAMCSNYFGPYIPPNPPNTTTTTTTTPKPTTTPTTVTPPPSPTPAPTPVPTNGTTTTAAPTPAPGNVTTSAPLPAPTTTPTPAPAPGGSFSFTNFLGGIVFTLALSSLGYVGWRFYRARNPNYHTF